MNSSKKFYILIGFLFFCCMVQFYKYQKSFAQEPQVEERVEEEKNNKYIYFLPRDIKGKLVKVEYLGKEMAVHYWNSKGVYCIKVYEIKYKSFPMKILLKKSGG